VESTIGRVCGPVGSGVEVVVVFAVEPQAERMTNNTRKEPANITRLYLLITQE